MPSVETPPSTTAHSGIIMSSTGERHIPSSTRADGSKRKEIKIRPGYRPPEDVEVYKNRTAQAWKNRGKGGIPGMEGLTDDGDMNAGSKANNKNAKRREARRKAKEAGTSTENMEKEAAAKEDWRSFSENPQGAASTEADEDAQKEKKIRNLRKKLKQAKELAEKKNHGENLLPDQLGKVIRIHELIRELQSLGFDPARENEVKGGEP
ncbi:MAG: hypothetical protein M1834_007323 [Cirrosporium novae-zelandiae]|nr:MAG: hypothetical protein M1834_007323 [Cirrosporium novae-zelandiae]